MKLTATIFSFAFALLFLSTSTADAETIKNSVKVTANGSNANANINISNNINTSSNTSNYSNSQSKTNIYINQSGEGTSSVKINGEEWKLEGPGEINVNENNTAKMETTLTVLPTIEPTTTPDSLISAENEDVGQVLGIQTENIQKQSSGFLEKFSNIISSFLSRLSGLFSAR